MPLNFAARFKIAIPILLTAAYFVATFSVCMAQKTSKDKKTIVLVNSVPGTINAADRFVRVSYLLKSSPKYKEREMATASVFSIMRAIGVPLGMGDPDHPNISATLWRTVSDHDAKIFYFDSALKPSVFWVDLNKIDFSEGGTPMAFAFDEGKELSGEVSAEFRPTEPIKWI